MGIDPMELETTSTDEPASAPDQAMAQPSNPASQPIQVAPVPSAVDNPSPIAPEQEPTAPAEPTTVTSVPTDDGGKQSFVNGLPVPPTAEEMNAHDIQLASDLASKAIHPKTYQDLYADKSTVGKAMTLFGLMIGGAGSGLTGQPNVVLQMMDKIIANDLEAQRASKAGANTWLSTSYNHEVQKADTAYKNAETGLMPLNAKQKQLQNQGYQIDNSIKAQTKAMNAMKLGMLSDFQGVVDKAPPAVQPQAQATLDNVVKPKIINDINQSNVQTSDLLNANFAKRQQQLRILGMGDIAQSNESRSIPGVGAAAVPVTSEDRSQILAAQNFANKINKYKEFVQSTSTIGKLNPAQINEGKVLAAELQTAFREATNGGVYKEGEKNYIDSIIPSDPTKFFGNIRVMPQINAIQDDANDRYGNLLKSKGLPAPKAVATEKKAPEEIKTVGGKKYRRGPNGEAIEVK